MAEIGPCGPCSEIHFDRGAHLSEGPHCVPDHTEHCPRWLEIWNLVFMEFDQRPGRPRAAAVRAASTRAWASSGSRASSSRCRLELRHRPVHADPRPDAGAARARPGRVRGGALQLPGHRRPLPGGDVPDRRRRAAVERGPRLRPARILRRARPPRPAARADGAVPRPAAEVVIDDMADAYPHLVERRDRDPRGDRAGGGPVRPDARRRHAACSRRSWRRWRPASGSSAGGRRTCPPTRRASRRVAFRLNDTYGFPIRPDGRAGGRVRRRRRPGRVRRRARGAAGAKPGRHEGRPARARPSGGAVRGDPGPGRRHGVPRLRDDVGRGAGRRDRPRRHRVRRADRPGAPPRSCSIGRRSMRRAAARSAIAGEIREAGGGSSLFTVEDTPEAGRRPDRPPRHAPRPAARRRDGERRRRRGAAGPHDAQPHGHPPAAPGAAQRRRRGGASGGLARDA